MLHLYKFVLLKVKYTCILYNSAYICFVLKQKLMIGFGRLHSHWVKVAGLTLSGIAMALWVIHYFVQLSFTNAMTPEQHGYLFWWFTLVGLYMAAFSHEKNDDERVKVIRAKSMLASFNLAMAFCISMSMLLFIEGDVTFHVSDLIILPTFCIVFYMLFFHLGVYYDKVWLYREEKGLFGGPGDKTFRYLIYVLIAGILLGLAIFKTVSKW